MIQPIQQKRSDLRHRRGFTLIELIIVIVIIGVLAMMAIPQMMGFTDAAREGTCKSNLKTVYSSAQMVVGTSATPSAMSDAQIKAAITDKNLLKADQMKCPTDGSTYTILNSSGDLTVQCENHGTYPEAVTP